MPHLPTPRKRQDGAVLLIGMILMLILMVGAVSLMNGTTLDERLAGNSKASAEAFYAAEAGYLTALEYLEPKDANDSEKLDLSEARVRWSKLYDQVDSFDTLERWNNRNQDPQLPAAMKAGASENAGAGKPTFAISFAPAFESKIDGNGNVVTKRIPDQLQFFSQGQAAGAVRRIGFNLDGGSLMGGGIKAPAAISCFGSGCNIQPGNARDASISGRDHPVPENNCGGKGGRNCWEEPLEDGKSVPAVFLANRDDSYLDGANGKGKNAYHGQDRTKADDEDTPHTQGNGVNSNSVWAPEDYPDDTAPKYDDFFGNGDDAKLKNVLDAVKKNPVPDGIFALDTSKDSTMPIDDKSASGVMVIDGNGTNKIKTSGTGFFAGLIILRGCNSIETSGNFTIYGAILVDGKDKNGKPCDCIDEQCKQKKPYYPFKGNGTIDVKYSLDALDQAGFGTGSTIGGGFTRDWYEIVNQ